MFRLQDAEYFRRRNLEYRTGGDGGGRDRSQRSRSGHRLLAKKIPGGEQRNRRFFATLGKDGELCPASLKIKHSVGWASLGKENLLYRVISDASSWPFGREKSSSIKGALFHFTHLDGLFLGVWSGRGSSSSALRGAAAGPSLPCRAHNSAIAKDSIVTGNCLFNLAHPRCMDRTGGQNRPLKGRSKRRAAIW